MIASTKALCDTWNTFKVCCNFHRIDGLYHSTCAFQIGTTYTSLFCSSLGAWCLLLDRAPPIARQLAFSMQPKLVAYVEGNQLEMRVSAGERFLSASALYLSIFRLNSVDLTGEALAFLYELAERSRINRFANHDHLCNVSDLFIKE